MNSFVDTIERRIQQIDAPFLLPLSPPSSLSVGEETPEEIIMLAHRALEEVHDIIAGVIMDTAAFLRFGSFGIAAFEAIFDIAQDFEIPILADVFSGASLSTSQSVLETFSFQGSFPCIAIRMACMGEEISRYIRSQSNSVVFLPEYPNAPYIYSSSADLLIRERNPKAFLLIDGNQPTMHFRNEAGGGVLHINRTVEPLLWKERSKPSLRNRFIDTSKDFLSLR